MAETAKRTTTPAHMTTSPTRRLFSIKMNRGQVSEQNHSFIQPVCYALSPEAQDNFNMQEMTGTEAGTLTVNRLTWP